MHALSKRCGAEFFGTFWLVLGGCGAAVLAAGVPDVGIGYAGVALAFGLTVLTMAFAVGHISGGHFNPAVTVGLLAGGRFPARDVLPCRGPGAGRRRGGGGAGLHRYGQDGVRPAGQASPPMAMAIILPAVLAAAFTAELVLTAGFIFVILGATSKRAPAGFAGIPIGLALTLIHLVSIPVTNTSVNPARSTGPALFVGGWAVEQLWLFWVAPIAGAVVGAIAYRLVSRPENE